MNADRPEAFRKYKAGTPLSPREIQIAERIARGLTAKETAAQLGLATGTIKVRLSQDIYPKLGVTTHGELIRHWIERVEMPNRGDCSTCCLRQAHLAGSDFPISIST